MNRHERRKYAAIHGKAALRKRLSENLPTIDVNKDYARRRGMVLGDIITTSMGNRYSVRIVDGEGEIT